MRKPAEMIKLMTALMIRLGVQEIEDLTQRGGNVNTYYKSDSCSLQLLLRSKKKKPLTILHFSLPRLGRIQPEQLIRFNLKTCAGIKQLCSKRTVQNGRDSKFYYIRFLSVVKKAFAGAYNIIYILTQSICKQLFCRILRIVLSQ